VLIGWQLSAWGQGIVAPKYSNEFLQIGVGARAAGMGNAMSATANDVTAAYWNPAGLTRIEEKHQVGLMHSEYFAGIAKYDYGGYTTQLENGRRLGLSVIRLGIDDIPNTLNFSDGESFDYSRISEFSVVDYAFLFSYAWNSANLEGLSYGANAKVINRRFGDFGQGWGFGLDVGAQYVGERLSLGVMLADITSTFTAYSFNTELFDSTFIATGNEVPENSVEVTLPSMRLGAAYRLPIQDNFAVTLAIDQAFFFDGQRNTLYRLGNQISVDGRAGLEASYKDLLFLRGGVMNFQQVPNVDGEDRLTVFPTAGLGINYRFFALDYALSNIGDFQDNLYSHLISLRLYFDRINL